MTLTINKLPNIMALSRKNIFALFSALAAAIVYGAWAIYANYEHGAHAWGMAGSIQAAYAFISTLSITHVAQWVFTKCNGGLHGVFLGFITSFIVMLALPLGVHSLAHTPDIWQTILPGLIWGSFYLLGVLITMNKQHHTTE